MHDTFIWGRVKRISPEAPVPVVEVTEETSLLGGAANVVNNILSLGAKATLAGVVGRDRAGEAVLKTLDEIGVDCSCVHRSKKRPTSVKTRIIAHHQQVVRFDKEDKSPIPTSTFKSLVRSLNKIEDDIDAVIVADYNKGLISRELMDHLLRFCREKKKILAVDPKPGHMDWYRGATVLTPNNNETGEAVGFEIETDSDLERAGKILLDRLDSRALLITRGEKGMSLFQPDTPPAHTPARAREVYDVTGAGDTVISTLTVAMAAGMEMADAVRLANLAAGIVVGKLGTSVATVEEIKTALDEKKN